jgi:hypothetical protein
MSTTWTFSDEEISTTSLTYLINSRQMQDRPRHFANDVIKHKAEDGEGHTVVIPWDVQRHSSTTRMITGYEAVNMDVQTVMKAGRDEWAYVLSPVVWSVRDEEQNSGKAKKISIIEKRTKDTDLRMLKEFEQRLLQANVPAWADLNTVNGFDTTTGFFESGTPGTQSNTVHEISKGTYSSLPGFQNQAGDVGGTASTTLLDQLRLMNLRIREITEDPTKLMGYASIAGANQYGKLVTANERYTGSERDAGRIEVLINGLKYTVTSALPNAGAGAGGTANDPWSFLLLDHGAAQLHTMPGKCMNMTEFNEISGFRVKAGFMEFFGQYTIDFFGSSGVIYDAET